MKKSNILIAVIAILAVVSTAKAQSIEVDFDGKAAGAGSFAELLRSDIHDSCQNDNMAYSIPVPEEVAYSTGSAVTVSVSIKIGDKKKQETLSCQRNSSTQGLDQCVKQSDSMVLTKHEAEGMLMRKYFSGGSDFESILDQTRHTYTNCQNTMCFTCTDKCVAWKPVSNTNSCTVGLNFGCTTSYTNVCVQESHECVCTKGC